MIKSLKPKLVQTPALFSNLLLEGAAVVNGKVFLQTEGGGLFVAGESAEEYVPSKRVKTEPDVVLSGEERTLPFDVLDLT